MKQKITDIQQLSENHLHRKIYLDDEPFVVIPSELIDKLGLRVGLEIRAEVIEKLITADEAMRAKKYALDLLSNDIFSKSQMTKQLEREGFREENIDIIITELIVAGHIRDRQYAEKWVQRRLKSNPRGRKLLRQELVDKGVDKETAEQVLSEVKTEVEEKLAHQIAKKRAKMYTKLPNDTAKRRLHGFLARRGFDSDIIMSVIDQVLKGQ
ncbi:MAG: regulatory protein RecX [Candidatus Poribacteria bacterium]|nr:regulatory protein RecX [Candidatus Poribacteria bacterium]